MTDSNIQERIESLKSDLHSYGKEILSLVESQYSPNLAMPLTFQFDMKHDPRNALFVLRQDLTDIINQKLNSIKHVDDVVSENVDDCQSRLTLLENVVRICDKFMDIDILLTSSDLKGLTKALMELQGNVNNLPSENESSIPNTIGHGYVCKLLRSEFRMIKERYHSRLRRLLEYCVTISLGKVSVIKRLTGLIPNEENIIDDPILIDDIWTSLTALDYSQECINKIIQNIWSSLLKPLLRERKSPPVKANIHSDKAEFSFELSFKTANNNSSTVIGLQSDSNDIENIYPKSISSKNLSQLNVRIPVANLIESFGHVLSFLWTEAFCGDESLSPLINIALSSPPQSFLPTIYDIINHAQPKVESDLIIYRKTLEKPLKEFEKKMISFGFIGNYNQQIKEHNQLILNKLDTRYHGIISPEPLSALLDRMTESFMDMRRKDILNRGREYIMADYHNIMLAAGDALEDDTTSAGNVGDPKAMLEQSGSYAMQALQFDPCQISLASCRLLKLVHEVLKQVSEASPTIANVLIQSCRDCLELFLFIIPVKYSETLHTSPRMGAVFYNDCLYIAHNTTLMTHLYRNLVDQRKLTFGFIDLIPRFRSIGEKILGHHVDEAKKIISQFVIQANINPLGETKSSNVATVVVTVSTSGSNSGQKVVNNEQVVGNILTHFARLKDHWCDVMQEAVYDRIMGHLMETMLRQFMETLLAPECTCITESAAADISRLFRSLQKVKSTISPDGNLGEEYLSKMAVISWSKFCSLTDLLEYSLTDIAEWLPRRKFSSFTSQQLSNLIKALFEDTPKRQSILLSIVDISN